MSDSFLVAVAVRARWIAALRSVTNERGATEVREILGCAAREGACARASATKTHSLHARRRAARAALALWPDLVSSNNAEDLALV